MALLVAPAGEDRRHCQPLHNTSFPSLLHMRVEWHLIASQMLGWIKRYSRRRLTAFLLVTWLLLIFFQHIQTELPPLPLPQLNTDHNTHTTDATSRRLVWDPGISNELGTRPYAVAFVVFHPRAGDTKHTVASLTAKVSNHTVKVTVESSAVTTPLKPIIIWYSLVELNPTTGIVESMVESLNIQLELLQSNTGATNAQSHSYNSYNSYSQHTHSRDANCQAASAFGQRYSPLVWTPTRQHSFSTSALLTPRFFSANTIALAFASLTLQLNFPPESPSPSSAPLPCVESLTFAAIEPGYSTRYSNPYTAESSTKTLKPSNCFCAVVTFSNCQEVPLLLFSLY